MKTSRLTRLVRPGALAALLATGLSALAQSGIHVSTRNGQTTVLWKGQPVFAGPTEGPVRASSVNVNGEEYAAAFAGETVIWENSPGAADKVKAGTKGPAAPPKGAGKGSQSSARSGVAVSTVNGQTTVTWQGRQVFVGPTRGGVSARSKTVHGKEFAAVFEGEQLLWENVRGAARQVK
jgi:hypothetical protein